MASNKVLVFGPTGNVGAATANTAAQRGAKVYLAMRDTSKALPEVDEKSGSFERIEADLTKPDTVSAAAQSSGAKRAFIYLAHGTPDHMKASLEALKTGGVEFVVFLSTASIEGDAAAEKPQNIIPFLHAQVELNLATIFGPTGFAAIRPGGFATNAITWYRAGIQSGEVHMYAPHFDLDWITPEDMGGVSGAVLVDGLKTPNPVFLFGPQRLGQEAAFRLVLQETGLGERVKLTPASKEAAQQAMVAGHIPPPIAEYLVNEMEKNSTPETSYIPDRLFAGGVQNVETYTGKPGLKFEDWVRQNTSRFV